MTDHPRRDPGDDPRDAQLRELLQNAVSDVEPTHGLDAIRSRTKVHPMTTRHPWLLAAGAAVLATAATITVVNLAGNDNPARTSDDVGPAAGPVAGKTSSAPATPSAATGSPSTQPAVPGAALPVYYVGDTTHGPRLYREFHAARGTNLEAEAVKDAVAGSPADPDYTSLWPRGADVQTVQKSGELIVVDLKGASLLHDRPAGMTPEQARLSVQQVIYTAQAGFQDRAPVQLLLDGRKSDAVLGVPTSEPLAQAAPEDVLAQVWIIDPGQDARVSSGFTVSGLAAAFEANVQWELKQGDKTVKDGFTTARECCTMSPYSFTVDAPPGDYTLVVHDDASGGEGPGPWQDTKDISIVP
jgi:hypothetical protein